MSSLDPPTETPGFNAATWPTQPTYSNLGEVRAHLLPSKACRTPTSGSSCTGPQHLPPPLPKKTLARALSLPTHRALSPSPTPAGQPPRPLLGSRSVDESQAGGDEARPACPPAELPFCSLDMELGLSLHDLHCPEAVHTVLAARQLEGLRAVHTRLQARFLGGRPGPCRPHHSFRLLDSLPCVKSGDTLYYRIVQVDKEAWHVLAAKVPKPGAKKPHPWGLELQASLPPHFNLQGLCGLVPEGALPEAPWIGPVVLAAEVPERTVAQWLVEAGAQRPPDFAWAVALMLLQLSRALEHLEARGATLTELRPENLLLVAPRGCAASGPQRLLLADFGRVYPRPSEALGAHALQLGRLLRTLLDRVPLATPLTAGLERLAAQLARVQPSATLTRGALQALLWGPGYELRGRGTSLGPWLRVRRALLVLHLAQRAAGGEVPGLEDWLCCEYLVEATEASMGGALELLWG
ncbi:PEAK family member 3 [Rhinolophus ferrumequinum]|uniref:PEAK family member 3 n=1 Tax=Rhinolophus ferrumequinum TaxID=59479 RepID=A0A671EQS5_RHIFE|nr:protein PEAK3 [Rhinolophus ferrumequinum]XP_032990110.1 protein PEAK3 [Rhinolophus ferrumequinum]XP_032990111.1 protein PEAK3 [Rhinolophus ferrumequinum]XP_032990112.1 protein PEAK3 [Rhinolophus ferrumequinum]XP_032990113.1 protein PEAK3 [Rhinolophus ferrumequinum]XP_032990114.1 protein PEAK3 [Rhinolophus ferrumequinum]KAF6306870.1 PEAK family member 3 [Rhinolophus ferrumequinum]